jgi:hypothetical protein
VTSKRRATSHSNRLEKAWNTCGYCGKRGYKTRAAARAAARRIRRQVEQPVDAPPMHIYRCSSGNNMFHLGHNKYLGPNLNEN